MRPKRVLLITSNFPRWDGDSTTPFIGNLARDLQETGWTTDILAPHAPGAARRETLNGVSVRRFRYLLPESQQTVCYGGGALVNLRQEKSNWLKLPFLALTELLATLRLLATRCYAAVNAHWLLPQGFVGAIAGAITRTPLVITVHGGDVFDLQGGILTWFKRWSLRRATAVTVNSSATRAAVESLGTAANVVTIPMGVDLPGTANIDKADAIRAEQPAETLLLFVGRLVMEKGVDDLLAAVQILARDGEDVRLLVAGTGQDEAQLQRLAADLGVADRVSFLGWVDPEEVPAYLQAADVFIGPSKQSASGWREGLGLVFLEAMAAGTPVVATASGGIPDIVRDGETGILVAEKSPQQIATAVRTMTNDAELRRRLVASGSELVSSRFSRRASAESFAALFDGVTGR